VFLDAETARVQSRVLVRIFQHFLGKERLPMVIVDHPNVVKDRRSFSARGAGILGMLQFGRQPIYALDEKMELNKALLDEYLAGHHGQRILYFGFTFIVWQHLVQALRKAGERLPAHDAILVHSGGWKKLEELRVAAGELNESVQECAGIPRCINFYGLVEQVGAVYLENGSQFLQTPVFSDVIIRNPVTLKPQPPGESGLIQLLSAIPTSYPGHSVLTEDLGVLASENSADPLMKGRSFRVLGRAPRSEIRGCSDTYTDTAT
jgi:hypothetical protein